MKIRSGRTLSRGKRAGGWTLVEVMVGLVLGSMLMAMTGSLWLFGNRTFAALGNYADLDARSRNALDLISRDLRPAARVTGFQNSGATRWLRVTNATAGTTITYTWSATPRTLVCQKTGQPDEVYLTECDRWDFELYQRAPQKNGCYAFYPSTNAAGVYDPSICKLVNMSWKCSRSILGSQANTESVQTAQLVLRNNQ